MGSVPETRDEWNARHGDRAVIKNAAGDLSVYMTYSGMPAPLRLPPLTYQLDLLKNPPVKPKKRRWRRRKNG